MKKFTITILSILIMTQISTAQQPWILPGNGLTNIGFDFVGTRDPMSLGFRTNNIERMQIFEPVIPAFNTGFVGIGDYTVFNPEANVHAHNSTNIDFVSFKATSANTGFLRNDGFSFGIAGGLNNIASIIQHESFPIDIRTHDIRSRIFIDFSSTTLGSPPANPITRIGIPEDGANFPPLSILHLGFSPTWMGASTLGGYRLWMDIGTLSAGPSEQVYVGLIESDTTNQFQIWNDHMDAAINWGDNVNPLDGANNLRFIFTSSEPAAATANQ